MGQGIVKNKSKEKREVVKISGAVGEGACGVLIFVSFFS